MACERAQAVACGQLVIAGAFLCCAIEVIVARNPEFQGGGNQRLDKLMGRPDVRCPLRTYRAMPGTLAADVVLELAKIGEHLHMAPARIAKRDPVIVILVLATDVNEPVDRARSPQRTAAWPIDLPAVHPGVGVGLEAPVVDRVKHRLCIPDRNVNPRIRIAWPGLQHQYRGPAIRGEAICEHAPGGAATDNHVIERAHWGPGGDQTPGMKGPDIRFPFNFSVLTARPTNCYTRLF